MINKKYIWCLFDDANGSWNKLNKDNILSIGINENDWNNYYKIDLSIQNKNLIKELSKLPKPSIIICSPPCESWSIADNSRRLWRKQEKSTIEIFTYQDELRNREKFNSGKRDYFKQWKSTLDGMSTIIGVVKIIEHFKPDIWIIENPATSKIWEFLEQTFNFVGHKNKTYYNAYNDTFTKKPTIFLSNKKLDLKKDHIKQKIIWEKVCGYGRRSSIPQELLEDILKQIEEK